MSIASKDGVIAVSASFVALSTIAVGLRFYARKIQRLPLRIDDTFAVLALIFYTVAVACILYRKAFQIRISIYPGPASDFIAEVHLKIVGYSFNDMARADYFAKMRLEAESGITYNIAVAASVAFVKLSALAFYRRTFCIDGLRRFIDYLLFGTAVVVVAWLLTYTILPFFQCGTHLDASWKADATKYCIYRGPYFISLVLSNLILDVWILCVPVPCILRLRTSVAKKCSIIGVFLLAFIGLGASIARTVIYFQLIYGGATYSVNHDVGLATTRAVYLALLEAGISLVAVNLPSLWFLFTSIAPEKALRSLRSVISITSMRSRRSNRSNEAIGNPTVHNGFQTMPPWSELGGASYDLGQALPHTSGSYRVETYAVEKVDNCC